MDVPHRDGVCNPSHHAWTYYKGTTKPGHSQDRQQSDRFNLGVDGKTPELVCVTPPFDLFLHLIPSIPVGLNRHGRNQRH